MPTLWRALLACTVLVPNLMVHHVAALHLWQDVLSVAFWCIPRPVPLFGFPLVYTPLWCIPTPVPIFVFPFWRIRAPVPFSCQLFAYFCHSGIHQSRFSNRLCASGGAHCGSQVVCSLPSASRSAGVKRRTGCETLSYMVDTKTRHSAFLEHSTISSTSFQFKTVPLVSWHSALRMMDNRVFETWQIQIGKCVPFVCGAIYPPVGWGISSRFQSRAQGCVYACMFWWILQNFKRNPWLLRPYWQ